MLLHMAGIRRPSAPFCAPIPRGASLALGVHDLRGTPWPGTCADERPVFTTMTSRPREEAEPVLTVWTPGYQIRGLGEFVVRRLVSQGAFGQVSTMTRHG